MRNNQCWIMLYSEIPITSYNEIDVTVLSHYLHLPERNCEKSIYLYLVKVTDDIPDYSTLQPFVHSSLSINYRVYESNLEEKGPDGIWIVIERKNENHYTLKLRTYEEKDYGRGIRYLTLFSTSSVTKDVEFLKILVGATHHWNIVCSENKINLKDRKSILGNNLKRCVEISGKTVEKEVYLYLVKGNIDILDCSTLKPLLQNEITVDYCIRKKKAIDRIEGLGVSLIHLAENRYFIAVNNVLQRNYFEGTGEYMVSPVLPDEIEESRVIHDLKIDTFEHWSILCSDNPLNLNSNHVIWISPSSLLSNCINLPIHENGIGEAAYYLYMVREKDGYFDYNTILPVTAESFDIESEYTDYGATGLEVSKVKDNCYIFHFNEEEREEPHYADELFLVTPRDSTLGKQVMLHCLELYGYYEFDR